MQSPSLSARVTKTKKKRDNATTCNQFNHTFLPILYYHMGIYDGCSKFKVYKLAEQRERKKN